MDEIITPVGEFYEVVEAPTYVGVAHGYGVFEKYGAKPTRWIALTRTKEDAERIAEALEFYDREQSP